jgi:hypothetical protein
MIDMGTVKGQHLFYTGGRSLEELMRDGKIVAIPNEQQGIVYKRTEIATEVEKMAALTIEEAKRVISDWNSRLD